jgi:RNA polymerase primary sigma factor
MRQLKIQASITSRDTDSLEKYLNEISKIELITPEQEAELAKKIRQGDSAAVERLTTANLRFVVSVAKQYQGHGMLLTDLINEGNLGLIKAAQKFDETKGFKFISYAVWWIRQAIMLAIVEQSRLVRLPMNKAGNYSKIQKMSSQLEQQFEREPTIEELADIMELKEGDVRNIALMQTRHISMDAPLNADSDDGGSLLDTFADDKSTTPDKVLLSDSLKSEISEALLTLTEREASVIATFYGINGYPQMSLDEIGLKFDLTTERVRQIKERAIRRLRKTSTSNGLKTYLG